MEAHLYPEQIRDFDAPAISPEGRGSEDENVSKNNAVELVEVNIPPGPCVPSAGARIVRSISKTVNCCIVPGTRIGCGGRDVARQPSPQTGACRSSRLGADHERSGICVGVDDYRAGRPMRNLEEEGADTNAQWNYERGRQWAAIAPRNMPIWIRGKLNRVAVRWLTCSMGT
jgi:hypothetical protein